MVASELSTANPPHAGAENSNPASATLPRDELMGLALGALGVVYGDIGTSPLYAIKECFTPGLGLPLTPENILGILSLVFWSLMMIVVFKYLTFVMRADNHGEGGIMAILALLRSKMGSETPSMKWLTRLAIFGTSLLLADGMITPAISVLSAIEGLEMATPVFKPFIVPLTVIILVALFLIQKHGTATVGKIFGPLMMGWFGVIGILGLYWVIRTPQILYAINPGYLIQHFMRNGWHGFLVLGSVILCVTGAEALYADMGHFGRAPIKLAWYWVAFPGLLLNYFGQGAALLALGETVRENPFFGLSPTFFLIPLVVISTMATIIASQALISGAYSLAQQAVQIGFWSRLTIKHTSSRASGQIYIPEVNTLLLICCCGLVLGFKESTHLAAAYGVAVMGTMTITTVLIFNVMVHIWDWKLWKAVALTAVFLSIDIPFLMANVGKIFHGGWIPLAIGATFFILMTTWHKGRRALSSELRRSLLPLANFIEDVSRSNIVRVKGTAIFMTPNLDVVPPVLLHHYKHNKMLHEKVVFLSIHSEPVPEIPVDKIVEVKELKLGFFQIIAKYGFMQTPNVPEILNCCSLQGIKFDLNEASFFLGRESLVLTGKSDMYYWRKWLFKFISRNSLEATAYFGIPPNRVLELGAQIEL